MTEIQNPKREYDLEEITFQFVKNIRLFVKTLPKTIANIEDGKQLIKASGSVGANYWLRLIHETNNIENTDEAESFVMLPKMKTGR